MRVFSALTSSGARVIVAPRNLHEGPEAAPKRDERLKGVADGRADQKLELVQEGDGLERFDLVGRERNGLYARDPPIAQDTTHDDRRLSGFRAWMKPRLEDAHEMDTWARLVP